MNRFLVAGCAVLVSLALFAAVFIGTGTALADDRPNIILMIAVIRRGVIGV